jgi:hypothetical protein
VFGFSGRIKILSVILAFLMTNQLLKYKTNPQLTDTVGFFDQSILYTDELHPPANDSLKKFFDYTVFSQGGWVKKQVVEKQVTVPSLFRGHQLKASTLRPVKMPDSSADWTVGAMLVCLLIYTWVQRFYTKRLRQIFKAAALPRYMNQLEREGNLFTERVSLGLSMVFLIIFTIALGQIFEYISGVNFSGKEGKWLYLELFAAVSGIWLIKAGIIKVTGIIFMTSEYARAYLLNNLIFNMITGLLLFLPVVMTAFSDATIYSWVSIVIISILMIYKVLRGVFIGITNSNFSILYLFIYLCTLEILPFVILYKALTGYTTI